MKQTAIRRRFGAGAAVLPFILATVLYAAEPKSPVSQGAQTAVSGEKMTVEGIIVKREADTLSMRDAKGSTIVVELTDATEVKERKSNPFRSGRNYATTQLVRGLIIEVEGRKNAAGQLVADELKLKDSDLRFASSV